MTSYLGIPFIRLAFIIALSLMFKALVNQRWRDRLTPWCFAGLIVHQNIASFTGGGAHFLALMVYFLEMAFLLDGLNLNYLFKNRALAAFFVFWGYLTLSSVYAPHAMFSITTWGANLLELVLVGYYTGIWVLRTPNGLQRLIKPLVFVGIASLYFYFRYGFATEMNASGRGVLDAELAEQDLGNNVNAIGLALAPTFVLMVAFLTERLNLSRAASYFWKISASVCLVLVAYLLIRTGSRNANLVFLPALYFVYKAFARQRKFAKLFVIGLLVCLPLYLCVKVFMSGAEGIRAFKLMETGEKFSFEGASSGRWSEFKWFLSDMEGVDYLIGKGPLVLASPEGLRMGGALSVYVTLFRFIGVLGIVLLMVYFLATWLACRRRGMLGQVAFLFFMAWAITGVAEGQGIRRGQGLRLLQGVSLALCSNLFPRGRREFGWNPAYGQPPRPGMRYPMPSQGIYRG